MIMNLQGQLTILKSMNIKPNFSELAREYDLDRRTVKKYYEGCETVADMAKRAASFEGVDFWINIILK